MHIPGLNSPRVYVAKLAQGFGSKAGPLPATTIWSSLPLRNDGGPSHKFLPALARCCLFGAMTDRRCGGRRDGKNGGSLQCYPLLFLWGIKFLILFTRCMPTFFFFLNLAVGMKLLIILKIKWKRNVSP